MYSNLKMIYKFFERKIQYHIQKQHSNIMLLMRFMRSFIVSIENKSVENVQFVYLFYLYSQTQEFKLWQKTVMTLHVLLQR